jgi:uncharacterized damage-inducible protein DinB
VPPDLTSPLDGPPVGETDTRALLVGYLDWYREALLRKIDGLSDAQLRAPLEPMGWSPLGLVQHLTWVEHRWLRWGFQAADVAPHPPGDDEWTVPADRATGAVLASWSAEAAHSREVVANAALDQPSAVGGRFATAEQAPALTRILFHLLQEYARHVGQLDIVRELLDGRTGE